MLYLGAHAVTGPQGLVAFAALKSEGAALEQQLAALDAERDALSRRAARLKSAALDLDYLDERARVLLARAEADEIVFALEP